MRVYIISISLLMLCLSMVIGSDTYDVISNIDNQNYLHHVSHGNKVSSNKGGISKDNIPADKINERTKNKQTVPRSQTKATPIDAATKDTPPVSSPPFTKPEITPRQEEVRKAMQWAWKGYKEYAWGSDHLLPVSRSSDTWFDLGLTLVDALDTLYIMNLNKEFEEGVTWIEKDFSLDSHKDINLFETTIRILGGFLSTYQLSQNNVFLRLATDLGDRLMCAFDTNSGIPLSDVNLRTRKAHGPAWSKMSSSSEVTTLQLEFTYLSYLTRDDKYRKVTDRVIEIVDANKPPNGLIPQWIDPTTGRFNGGTLTLGARGDSYYEYLLKSWIQTGKTDNRLKEMYEQAISSVDELMVGESTNDKLTFIGEIQNNEKIAKMDHLVCFLPGTLALGAKNGLGGGLNGRHMQLAKDLAYTCYQTYNKMPSGLAPEITHFKYNSQFSGINPIDGTDLIVKQNDAHNLLRPETIESFFYLYRITGDEKYRDWGWEIFQSFERYTKVETGGYTSLSNVLRVPPSKRDKMESFFLGETLKYFYLLFSDDMTLMNLDEVVFNTEAHPFPILTK